MIQDAGHQVGSGEKEKEGLSCRGPFPCSEKRRYQKRDTLGNLLILKCMVVRMYSNSVYTRRDSSMKLNLSIYPDVCLCAANINLRWI